MVENLSKRLRQAVTISFHCRIHCNSCTLVTRQGSTILKVGMAHVYLALKRRVGCGYRWPVIPLMVCMAIFANGPPRLSMAVTDGPPDHLHCHRWSLFATDGPFKETSHMCRGCFLHHVMEQMCYS